MRICNRLLKEQVSKRRRDVIGKKLDKLFPKVRVMVSADSFEAIAISHEIGLNFANIKLDNNFSFKRLSIKDVYF